MCVRVCVAFCGWKGKDQLENEVGEAAPEPRMQLHWHFPSLGDNQSTFFPPKLAWILVSFKQVSPAQHWSFLLTFMPSSPSFDAHVLSHNCSSGQISSQPWICITGIPFPSPHLTSTSPAPTPSVFFMLDHQLHWLENQLLFIFFQNPHS